MSGNGSGAIQPQVEISSTLLLTKNAIISLLRSASHDEVHPQALLVVEQLGAKMSGSLSAKRIEEGVNALSNANYQRFDWLKLSIGLFPGGISRIMRESVSCVAAFLFIIACKTYLTDPEIARLLYLMAEGTRLTRDIPTSTSQIEDVVSSISGFGDSLLPTNVYNHVMTTLDQYTRAYGQGVDFQLLRPSSIETVAEVFHRVFEALKDEEVVKVSLEGKVTAVWLFSVFFWLFPDQTECIAASGQRLCGPSSARISLCLSNCNWTVREWRAEAKVLSVVIGNEIDHISQQEDTDLNYMPLHDARTTIGCQIGLQLEKVEAMGPLAVALIDFAFEFGQLYSEDFDTSVPLRVLAQADFILKHHSIVKEFGWTIDDDFRGEQREYTHALRLLMDKKFGTEVDDFSEKIFSCFSSKFGTASSTHLKCSPVDRHIISPAIHVATEAIYYCFCSRLPACRLFRWGSYSQNIANKAMLWALLSLPTRKGTPQAKVTLKRFRAEAFKAMLPGLTGVTENDLVVSFGGYVAFSSVIEKPTSDPRHCSSISVVPGTLRYRNEPGRFERLAEAEIVDDFFPTAPIVGYGESHSRLCVFQGSNYQGIESKADPEGIQVQTLLSAHRRTLSLKTYFQCGDWDKSCGAHSKAWRVSISWKHSIDAIAFAHHVSGHDLPLIAEEELAHALRQRGNLQTISWQIAGSNAGSGSSWIMMTSSNDLLRFFEAGRWRQMSSRRGHSIFLRHTAPLIQCIKEATDTTSNNEHVGKKWIILC